VLDRLEALRLHLGGLLGVSLAAPEAERAAPLGQVGATGARRRRRQVEVRPDMLRVDGDRLLNSPTSS
jgi:hypothetical protein